MRLTRIVPPCVLGLGILALLAGSSLLRTSCDNGVVRAPAPTTFSTGAAVPALRSMAPLHQDPAPLTSGEQASSSCYDDSLPARLKRQFLLNPHLLPAGVPGSPGEPLHLTFATASVDELLGNWAAHARRLRLPAVVSAMDRVVLERCPRLRVHCLANLDRAMDQRMTAEAARNGLSDASDRKSVV